MRRVKITSLATLSSLAVLVFLALWHQNSVIYPLFLRIGNTFPTLNNPQTHGLAYVIIEDNLQSQGYLKIVHTKTDNHPVLENSILIASSIANENSFGKGRSFKDFYETISSLDYPKSLMNLAIYCGSLQVLKIVTDFFEAKINNASCPYRKVTILYAPFLQNGFKSSDHDPKIQRLRRRSIARGRNFVLFNSLETEQYTLFLDSDIISFDQTDVLSHFVNSGKDIVVPRIERGDLTDYDKNSWRGRRRTPSASQIQLMDENKWNEANFVPGDIKNEIFHLGDHVKYSKLLSTSDSRLDLSYTVALDSIGGAVLFAKSIIFKQGAVFPTMNIIGTTWQRKEGYDGIETEGLCYMAHSMGYRCYGMPNLVAQHSR